MRKKLLKKELNVYREELLKLREEVYSEIRRISEDVLMKTQTEASGDISSHTFHLADAASDNFERDFSLGLASNEMEIIRQIDLALRKIDDSSYGICEACEKPIPKRRLDALPYVRNCLKCQENLDQQKQT
ncbi:MAG: TraR/DksA C4-type zinc finger protein [Candidatus Omnitrophica bacterium]|nr:TraR/DksA C4-type zinc finger protein [Candidatus Omnitrophota bacterium]